MFMALSLLTCRPGVKLQLHGKMVCRLGVLLLGPSNVKVLGGEVEDLVERNNQVNWDINSKFNKCPWSFTNQLCIIIQIP